MKEIIINSKRHGVHKAFIDDEDINVISKYKWHVLKGARTFYAVASIKTESAKTSLVMHKLLLKTSKFIDHRDGNGLNNCRDNLRECSKTENNRNARASKHNQTGFKGVSYSQERKKFESKICVNGKTIHLGRHKDAIQAAIAYNEAATKYFGEFAKLNNV